MRKIYLGVGSNIDRRKHIRCALEELQAVFGELELSPVYQTEAIGFQGDDFLNLVVAFDSDISVAELSSVLKALVLHKY